MENIPYKFFISLFFTLVNYSSLLIKSIAKAKLLKKKKKKKNKKLKLVFMQLQV